MSQTGKRSIVASVVIALVFVLGASSAWGSGLKVRAGRIGGIAVPFGTRAVRGTSGDPSGSTSAGATSAGDAGPGSPSPYCSSPPEPACVPPLLYNGGPVMHAVTTHVIAWAPSGFTFPAGYVSGYETYLADVRHDLGRSSNVSSVASEYVDAGGSTLSSLTNDTAIADTDSYPTSGCTVFGGATRCLTEAQLLAEVKSVIATDGLSVDVNQSYIVLLPPTVDSCFDSSSSNCEDQAFCGYHDIFSIGSAEATFTLLRYTESAYANAGAGSCELTLVRPTPPARAPT